MNSNLLPESAPSFECAWAARLSLPSDVLQAFKEPVDILNKKFRLYLAIMLYREAELSLERASKLAGLCIEDFLYELK